MLLDYFKCFGSCLYFADDQTFIHHFLPLFKTSSAWRELAGFAEEPQEF